MPDFRLFAEFDEGFSGEVGFGVDERFTCDEYERAVLADVVLVETKSLAQDTLNAVANDGAAQPPSCRKTNFTFKVWIIRDVKDKISIGYGAAACVNLLEVAQDLVFVQFKHRFSYKKKGHQR